MSVNILLKRAYEPESPNDGFRIYVDRLWPQGLSHETFHYDLWEKDLSPSTELREWFHADPDNRWNEFVTRYKAELKANSALEGFKKTVYSHPLVTLLFSSRNCVHNNAVVLRQVLLND